MKKSRSFFDRLVFCLVVLEVTVYCCVEHEKHETPEEAESYLVILNLSVCNHGSSLSALSDLSIRYHVCFHLSRKKYYFSGQFLTGLGALGAVGMQFSSCIVM